MFLFIVIGIVFFTFHYLPVFIPDYSHLFSLTGICYYFFLLTRCFFIYSGTFLHYMCYGMCCYQRLTCVSIYSYYYISILNYFTSSYLFLFTPSYSYSLVLTSTYSRISLPIAKYRVNFLLNIIYYSLYQ